MRTNNSFSRWLAYNYGCISTHSSFSRCSTFGNNDLPSATLDIYFQQLTRTSREPISIGDVADNPLLFWSFAKVLWLFSQSLRQVPQSLRESNKATAKRRYHNFKILRILHWRLSYFWQMIENHVKCTLLRWGSVLRDAAIWNDRVLWRRLLINLRYFPSVTLQNFWSMDTGCQR